MSVETSPNLRCMRGPYFRERFRRVWCGNGPTMWCKFPIMASFLGPGGRIGDDELFLGDNLLLSFAKKIKAKIMRVMIVEGMNDEFCSSIISQRNIV